MTAARAYTLAGRVARAARRSTGPAQESARQQITLRVGSVTDDTIGNMHTTVGSEARLAVARPSIPIFVADAGRRCGGGRLRRCCHGALRRRCRRSLRRHGRRHVRWHRRRRCRRSRHRRLRRRRSWMPRRHGRWHVRWNLRTLCWSLRNFDMFPGRVAIPDASTACLRRNMGKPSVDTPVLVSSGHHKWDSDPLSGALDLRDHSLPFLRRTAVADEHHRTLVSFDPFQGAR